MRFVAIGGDAAGMSAASKIKRLVPDAQVTVLEQSQDVSYSACGMPYNIADPARPVEDLVVRSASVFKEKQGIEMRLGHRAEQITPSEKTVSGVSEDGKAFQLPYDTLLIATGGRAIVPDVPGLSGNGVVVLKNLADARRIKARVQQQQVKKAVILGMGYIALEMAEAFRQLGIAVVMIKPRPQLLPWMPEALSAIVKAELEAHDVALHAGCELKQVTHDGDQLNVMCDNFEMTCDLLLVAVGIQPNSEIAAGAGIELGIHNAVSVDRCMRTSVPDIYAAGDCADAYHVVSGKKVWIPLALRANRAGWAVAEHLAGRAVELAGVAGTAVFKVFGLEVARTGLTLADAAAAGFDPASVTIKTRSRAHAHPGAQTIHVHMVGDTRTGKLLGVQMVGPEGVAHRINAAAVALHAGLSVEQFYQSDLAYAPPFGPVWDPLLTAGGQLLKKL